MTSRSCALAVQAPTTANPASAATILHPFIMGLSFAMIGVIGKDGCCAPQLLGQHRPRHHVWPCHAAKGDQQVRARAFLVAKAVGSADHQATFADALLAPAGKAARKLK